MSLVKNLSFLKMGGVLLLPFFCLSCEQFSGEFEAKKFVLFETIKYNDGCVSTLYVDGEYVTQVKNKDCVTYMKNVVFGGQ